MNDGIHGIITPMVTPLVDDRTLDLCGTERLIEHLLKSGVSGLFILGTTGEGQHLGHELRHELVRGVCRAVNRRVPVLVGISDNVFEASLDLARVATDAGAFGVVASPPCYFALEKSELTSYFNKLARKQPLPLFLYNMPAHTKSMIGLDVVTPLSRNPKIAGIKDSSGNISYFSNLCRIKRERPDFMVFMGPDEAVGAAVLLGADGGVNSGSNVKPELFTALYQAASAKDIASTVLLQEKILAMDAEIYTIGKSAARNIAAIKCALNILGICNEAMSAPFKSFSLSERNRVKQCVMPDGG